MNFSLGQRIFLAFAGLILVVVSTAVGVTYYRSNDIAGQSVNNALRQVRAVQTTFEDQRFLQLELMTALMASDPAFGSYVARAFGDSLGFGGDDLDTASLVDQLNERRQTLGYDLAIVLDDSGGQGASTDQSLPLDYDWITHNVVGPAIEQIIPTSGYWFNDGKAYQISVMPISDQDDLTGFLVTGFAVDNSYIRSIKNVTATELMLLVTNGGKLNSIAGTLGDAASDELTTHSSLLLEAVDKDPIRIEIDGRNWLATVSRAGGSSSAGTFIALRSLDEALADFKAVQRLLLIVMLISLFMALPLSLMIAKGILSPLRKLAVGAETAAKGDYSYQFKDSGAGEINDLTNSFNSLLSNLREKEDMEGYMSDLAKFLPDGSENTEGYSMTRNISPIQDDVYTLLGLDLRRFRDEAHEMQPAEAIAVFTANIKNIAYISKGYGGEIVAVAGHRVTMIFGGKQSHLHALAAAGDCLSNLLSAGEGVAAAIIRGKAVRGSIQEGATLYESYIGIAAYQLDRLIQEAVPGRIFVTQSYQKVMQKRFENLKVEATAGAISGKKFFSINASECKSLGIMPDSDTIQTPTNSEATSSHVHVGPGATFAGRYEILSQLGEGGMGVVYKAHDSQLNDVVALKMLRSTGMGWTTHDLEAMKQELKLARKITHPAILRTHDYGEVSGVPYISMEYVRGMTLKYLMSQSGILPFSAMLRITRQLAYGLQAAHAESVLHRDIKPENIILEANGNAKLMDFGIAVGNTNVSGVDENGRVSGTPAYSAPEQLQGSQLNETADIYALGVVVYQMVTGELPHQASTISEMITKKISEPPLSPSHFNPNVSDKLDAFILSCIALRSVDRFANTSELIEALDELKV